MHCMYSRDGKVENMSSVTYRMGDRVRYEKNFGFSAFDT